MAAHVVLLASTAASYGSIGRASRRLSGFVQPKGRHRLLSALSQQAQGQWEPLHRNQARPSVSIIDLTHDVPTCYGTAMALQRRLVDERVTNRTTDSIVLVEHEPVYTLGRGATEEHVLFDSSSEDAPNLIRCERGGDVTYHGPGAHVPIEITSAIQLAQASS